MGKRPCPTPTGDEGGAANGFVSGAGGEHQHVSKKPAFAGSPQNAVYLTGHHPPQENSVHSATNGSTGVAGGEQSNGAGISGEAGNSQANGISGIEGIGIANGMVEAISEGTSSSNDPVPNRLKPHDPELQIREVTNDGDAANMEMLIHLKVGHLVVVAFCSCFNGGSCCWRLSSL